MSDIRTYKEWKMNPSYHGSYEDYVRQMRAMEASRQRESEERIADLVVAKLQERER
jgi:hypothetical protein